MLLFSLIAIVRRRGQVLSLADGIFWGVGLLQIVLYCVDMRWLDGHESARQAVLTARNTIEVVAAVNMAENALAH